MFNDIMIDIETLATGPRALILTIGAMKFDRNGSTLSNAAENEHFYERVNYDVKNTDYDVDEKTYEWWNKQPLLVKQDALYCDDRIDLKVALTKLTEWINGSRYVWANGSVFDIVILEHAYRICELPIPWKFWDIRDVRTIMDVGSVYKKNLQITNAHHALHDCHWQIKAVQSAIRKMTPK